MTRDEAVAAIQQGLGFRSDMQTQIIAALDDAQKFHEMGKNLPWFLASEATPISGGAGTGTFAIPTDFIDEMDDGALSFVTTDGPIRFLRKRPYDWVISNNQDDEGNQTSGDPLYYALRRTTVVLRPIPELAWTGAWDYWAKEPLPSALAGSATNDWLTEAPGVIVNYAGREMAADTRDDPAAKTFSASYDLWKDALERQMVKRDEMNNEHVMGSMS